MSSTSPKASQIALSAGLGLLYGLAVAWLAALMTGAGHGWSSAIASILGLALIPVANVARLFMHSGWGRLAGLGCVAGGVFVDVLILGDTFSSGVGYVTRVFDAAPHLFFGWLLLWLGWQFVLLAMCLVPSPKC